jgi:predicted GNAT family acetyltransferase
MHLTTFRDAAEFLAQAGPALEQHEVENNLMLGIATRLRKSPESIREQPYLAVVQDEGGLVAAALMTPPHGVIVHAERGDAQVGFARIAHDLQANGWSVSGVIGRSESAEDFLSIWRRLTGAQVKRTTHERLYQLERVIGPRPSTGACRCASPPDVALVAAWLHAFQQEALPDRPHPEAMEWAQARVGAGQVWLWEDAGVPVSMAARGRETPHGATIGPVYTPPAHRRRGYASAVTGELSQIILDSGCRYAMLFTDLSNPTSNSIYQRIGYVPVCDYCEYILDRREEPDT